MKCLGTEQGQILPEGFHYSAAQAHRSNSKSTIPSILSQNSIITWILYISPIQIGLDLNGIPISWYERSTSLIDSYGLDGLQTLADLASQRSNCMKRRVGAILVRENRIVSTG